MILTSKIRVITRFAALSVLAVTAGCVYRVGDLTLVSTKNIDLTDTKLDAKQGQRKTGEDCRFVLLGLIPFGLPNLKEAVDRALEAGGGNIMVDEVTEFKYAWVVLGDINCWVARGTVLNVPVDAASTAPRTVTPVKR